MKYAENIRKVEALGIDWTGFIFWQKSSRYVSERPSYLPTRCKRVGVFVDASIGDVMTIAEQYQLDLIQLHGNESPSYITQLRPHLEALSTTRTPHPYRGGGRGGVKIIKAINIATASNLDTTKQYEGIADYFLFDTKGKSVGGNGEKFDWSVLSSYKGHTPFLLSGGIGPDDAPLVKQVAEDLQSPLLGIDLNSKFEISPALKDITKLRNFIKELSI